MRELGEHHLDVATTKNHLGNAERMLGHPAEAERLYREAVASSRAAVGSDTVLFLQNLAGVLIRQGALDEAEQALREGDAWIAAGGHAAPEHLVQQPLFHARIANARREFADARRHLDRALAWLDEHPDCSARLHIRILELARSVCTSEEDFATAEQYGERVLALWEATQPEISMPVANAVAALGTVAFYSGDYEKARARYARALDIGGAVFESDPDNLELADLRVALGRVLETTDRHAEAEEHFAEGLRILDRHPGQDGCARQASIR